MATPPPRWPRSSTGSEAGEPWRGRVWSLMALGPFALGWWRRLLDFRLQGYALAILGAAATTIYLPYPALSLAVVAAVAYAFVQTTLWSSDDRFGEDERNALRLAASCLTTMALCTLVWRLVPGEYLGIAWLALALLMLEAGLRGLPDEFRHLSWIVGILAVTRVASFDLSSRLALISSGLAYAYALRARKEVEWPRARCRHLAGDALPPGRPRRATARLGRSVPPGRWPRWVSPNSTAAACARRPSC